MQHRPSTPPAPAVSESGTALAQGLKGRQITVTSTGELSRRRTVRGDGPAPAARSRVTERTPEQTARRV